MTALNSKNSSVLRDIDESAMAFARPRSAPTKALADDMPLPVVRKKAKKIPFKKKHMKHPKTGARTAKTQSKKLTDNKSISIITAKTRWFLPSRLGRAWSVKTKSISDDIANGRLAAAEVDGHQQISFKTAMTYAVKNEYDADALFQNGSNVINIISKLERGEISKTFFVKATDFQWITAAWEQPGSTLKLAIALRMIAGCTTMDNTEKIETAFFINQQQLAKICACKVSSIARGVTFLKKQRLITVHNQGPHAARFRVIDAFKPKESTKTN